MFDSTKLVNLIDLVLPGNCSKLMMETCKSEKSTSKSKDQNKAKPLSRTNLFLGVDIIWKITNIAAKVNNVMYMI